MSKYDISSKPAHGRCRKGADNFSKPEMVVFYQIYKNKPMKRKNGGDKFNIAMCFQ